MLVLTRKKGQSINIGDDISVVILEINRDSVRLGIKAPPDMAIYRDEIYEILRKENIQAVASKDSIKKLLASAEQGQKEK